MADPLLDAYTSRAQVAGFHESDAPSTWSDTVAASFALTRREEITSSAFNAWEKKIQDRAAIIKKLGGDEAIALEYPTDGKRRQRMRAMEMGGQPDLEARQRGRATLEEAEAYVNSFVQKYPDQVLDDRALAEQMRKELAVQRMRDQDVIDRGGGFASFAGTAGGVLTDPVVIATAPIGGGAGPGKTVLGTIGKAALAEGSVAALTEIPVQAQVYQFKQDIESPWGFADSAVNVLAAGAGGAVLGGTIAGGAAGYKKALAKYQELKAAGKVTETPEMKAAEEALETAVSAQDQNPLHQDVGLEAFAAETHVRALETAQAQVDADLPVDVSRVVAGMEAPDPVGQAGVRAADSTALVDVDPLKLHVDAKQFQFKGGGDAEGVTGALRDVERFDRRLAGVALIWERADGKQFIADGHQRVALARRAIAAGQPAEEVRLNGFVLREADGVTAVDARRMAAVKNMAEGSGSALDAAKILRDVGPVGEALLPPLPPRSALVRQARGLAALGDEEFLQVVNGVVEPNVGGLVGAATPDPKLQGAMIQVLKRAQPANEVQARGIIEQVKNQGLETRTTEDLFGEQSFSESLYLERAQVLDQALKLAREDKTIFGALVRNEDRITAGGSNSLDRAGNLARSQEAADAATQITVRANAKGALSEALTDAARKVREGAKPATVAKSFLKTARREILQGDRGGRAPGKARPGGNEKGAAGRLNQPVRLAAVPAPDRAAVSADFKAKQAGRTVEQLYQVAETHQATYVKACEEIAEELGDAVEFKNPGVKKRARTDAKMERKGYRDAGQLTDVIRAGFVTRSPEVAAQVLDRLAQKGFEVLDEGVNVTELGYVDEKALIRFPDGTIAEMQLWDAALLKAKEPTGHKLYEEAQAITTAEKATPEGAAKFEALQEASKDLYAQSLVDATPEWRRVVMMAVPEDMRVRIQDALAGKGAGAGSSGSPGNISKKAGSDSLKPDSATSAGSQRDQSSSPVATKNDSTPPSSEGRVTAGLPSQLKNLSAIDASPRSIIHKVDDPKSAQPTDSKTGTVEDGDFDAVMSQYQNLLDDHGQLLRVTETIDGVTTERPVSGVIDELDTLEESLERIRLCSVPARAA